MRYIRTDQQRVTKVKGHEQLMLKIFKRIFFSELNGLDFE